MGEHRHSNRAIPIGNAEHELLQNIQGTTNNLDDGTGTDIHAHDNIASNNTAGGLLVDGGDFAERGGLAAAGCGGLL